VLTFDEKVAAVRAWYAAFNARDVRGLCEVAHPAIEIAPMRPLMAPLLGAAFHGHTGVKSLMQWTFEHYPRIHVARADPRESGRWITVETTFIIDVEAVPPHRRNVWSVYDIEPDGIRRIGAYATADEARAAARPNSTLTPREREVFGLLAQGLTATEIAEELVLSPLTVRTHIQNGKDRLGAKTRMEALSIALTRGELSV
jgi:DNA-binding CsgD family transcriptional regulator